MEHDPEILRVRKKRKLVPDNTLKIGGRTVCLDGYFQPPKPAQAASVPTVAPSQSNSECRETDESALVQGKVKSEAKKPTHRHESKRKADSNSNDKTDGGTDDASLLKTRRQLPIWRHKTDIQAAFRPVGQDVLLLAGETGSGKSTQVPQFLYREDWCQRRTVRVSSRTDPSKTEEVSVGGIVAITQPRRVAATTLAHRVAAEAGAPIGASARGLVGYSVRFDHRVPRGARIKFLTEGMLLQELLHDPDLRDYSAIVVDEVHERSIDVDLLTGFLRQIVDGDKAGRGGLPLKVVIMSATADVDVMRDFFESGQRTKQAADNRSVTSLLKNEEGGGLSKTEEGESCDKDKGDDNDDDGKVKGEGDVHEDASKHVGEKEDKRIGSDANVEPNERSKGDNNGDNTARNESTSNQASPVEVLRIQGRQHPVEITHAPDPVPDVQDALLKTIFRIHLHEPLPGDILAFLTGQEEIEAAQKLVEEYAATLGTDKPPLRPFPLYGQLSIEAQHRAFQPLRESFARKVVLATNIAETSVTVPGVRYVVDCGKAKVKQFRARLGMESLLAKPISRSSAVQRAGRAGREAPGKCFRLYTEQSYSELAEADLPEMLRSDVLGAALTMKARGVVDPLTFPLVSPPPAEALQRALSHLHFLGALDGCGAITSAGRKMACFPVSAPYARVLLVASEPRFDCLLEVVDIVACLTAGEDVFLHVNSEEDGSDVVEELRRALYRREGDLLTYLTTLRHFVAENADRVGWCARRRIGLRNMRQALNIRRQLRALCLRVGLLTAAPPPDPQPFSPPSPERAEAVLRCFLRGFAFRTAVLAPDGSYVTVRGKHVVAVHPSSVLCGQKREAILFLEHVFTQRSWARRVSSVQASWIAEALEGDEAP